MPEGTYSPVTLNDFSGGWVSKYDREPDSLRMNESPELENLDFDGQGSFRVRRGMKLFGNRVSTAGSIITCWTFQRPIRVDEIPMRQRGTLLEYYNSDSSQWETVPVTQSLSASRKLGFANYTATTDTEDFVYFCDGSMNMERWTGGHTLLNGALAGGEGTITVDSTDGFASSGSIYIGSTTVTYAAKTATTFTTCVGTPAAADNAVVTQVPVVFSASAGTKPVGNIMTVFNNQLVVAVKNYIKASDVDDFRDWNPATSSLAFSKGFPGGTITGLATKDKKLIVFTANSVQGIEYSFTGDLTSFQLVVEDIEKSPNYGAKVFTGIAGADGETYYVSNDNVIRRIIRSPVSTLFDTGSISENIRNQLAKYTMTNAAVTFFKNKLYFAVQSDESSINDVVLVFDLKYSRSNPSGEAWSKYRMYVADWFVYGGNLYCGSSAQINTFQMFTDNNGEPILDDDGASIPWFYKTPLLDFGKSELQYRLNKVVSRGYISQNSEVSYVAEYNYATEAEQEQTLQGSNESFVFVPAANALGEDVTGEEVTGSADDPFDGAYPFNYPFDFGTYDGYNLQIIISGNTKDEQYKQTRLVLYVEAQDDNMTN